MLAPSESTHAMNVCCVMQNFLGRIPQLRRHLNQIVHTQTQFEMHSSQFLSVTEEPRSVFLDRGALAQQIGSLRENDISSPVQRFRKWIRPVAESEKDPQKLRRGTT